jgi:hypothetical protein
MKSGWAVAPNPTNDQWHFISQYEKIISFELYDSSGKKIQDFAPNELQFTVAGSSLSSGLYFGKITTTSFSKSVKLVKR